VPADPVAGDDPTGGAPVARTRIARGSGPIQRPTPVVGIDFGTTYTCVSAALGNRVTVLPWADGSRAAPSVIGFPNRGQHVIGAAARDRLLFDPKHAIPAAKRLLGRQAADRAIESHLAQAPFKTAAAADGTIMVEMWGEGYTITQLCSYLIAEARDVAERAIGERVDRAVFTVPVSFGADRVDLLRRAAELARVEAIEIIDEPSAAALANRYRPDFGGIIGLFDFGGGTFDFSVVDGSAGDFRVLATAGDDWLGGDDLDLAVAEAVANQYWRLHGVDMRKRAVEWQYLVFACEQAKRRLSTDQLTHIFVPEVFRDAHGAHDLRMRLRRDPVEELWAAPIKRALTTCVHALEPLGLHPSDLSAIYLSGGTSYVPAVRRALEQNFHLPVRVGVPPEFAACLGAGIHAAQIERRIGTTLQALS
jgi:molecular chaperone DnaK